MLFALYGVDSSYSQFKWHKNCLHVTLTRYACETLMSPIMAESKEDGSGHRDRQIPQVTGTDRYLDASTKILLQGMLMSKSYHFVNE